ncbi:MAG: FKBP-type peptidyl-prolyl cis-trans isomerase [Dehalococcoidia bacterium]
MAQIGSNVSVHYRGILDDGTEFDSSEGRDPLPFTVGAGEVIAGFDEAVVGMEVGEKKTFRLDPEQAYGERSDERIITVPAEQAPEGLEAGQQVMLGNAPATVVEVGDEGVKVDANHPLAGEALTFEIELVSIEQPEAAE